MLVVLPYRAHWIHTRREKAWCFLGGEAKERGEAKANTLTVLAVSLGVREMSPCSDSGELPAWIHPDDAEDPSLELASWLVVGFRDGRCIGSFAFVLKLSDRSHGNIPFF
jgi:hypothetical protein